MCGGLGCDCSSEAREQQLLEEGAVITCMFCKQHVLVGCICCKVQPLTVLFLAGNLLCWFMLWTENKTMHVKWWTCPEPPDNCLEHSKAHHSDSHGSMDAASAEPIVCTISSRSFTGTENATQGMAPSK